MKKFLLGVIVTGVAVEASLLGVALTRSRDRQPGEPSVTARSSARGVSASATDDPGALTDGAMTLEARGMSYAVGLDRTGSVMPEAEQRAFAPVKRAVLNAGPDAGSNAGERRVSEAIAAFNASPARVGPPIVLFGEALAAKGVTVHASYGGLTSGRFVVNLSASSTGEEARVIIPPGTTIKSSSSDLQDTTVVDLTILEARTRTSRPAPATICCAEIGKDDPRGRPAVSVGRPARLDVTKVATFAAREKSDWLATQVALWAVANDADRETVEKAPGPYACAIGAARDLLEGARIDTNALALFRSEKPVVREWSFEAPGALFGRRRG